MKCNPRATWGQGGTYPGRGCWLCRLLAGIGPLRDALALALALRVVVRGVSMLPTLAPGERVLVDRLAYHCRPPREGDPVLAVLAGRRVLKRVGATVGEGLFLLVGDNAQMSTDSRELGPVGREAILGRVWLVYWPPGRVRRVR